MTRGRTAPQLAADTAPHRGIALLLELLFDSGPLRLCLGPWSITVGGNVYTATGPAISVEPHNETAEGIEGLQFTLSGLDTAIFAIVDTEPYHRRPVRLLEQRFDANDAPVGDPTAEFIGRMVELNYAEDVAAGTATVTVVAEHFEAIARRSRDLRFSHAEQLRRFPGDLGAEYAASLVERIVARK